MKKEMILTESSTSSNEILRFVTDFKAWVQTPIKWLQGYYSSVLEKEVSERQASYITQSQMAFILTIFPIFNSIIIQGSMLLWLLYSLYKCKKG